MKMNNGWLSLPTDMVGPAWLGFHFLLHETLLGAKGLCCMDCNKCGVMLSLWEMKPETSFPLSKKRTYSRMMDSVSNLLFKTKSDS